MTQNVTETLAPVVPIKAETTPTAAQVRAFARGEGHPVADKGRVAKDLYAAFAKAPKRVQRKYAA